MNDEKKIAVLKVDDDTLQNIAEAFGTEIISRREGETDEELIARVREPVVEKKMEKTVITLEVPFGIPRDDVVRAFEGGPFLGTEIIEVTQYEKSDSGLIWKRKET